MDLSYRGSTWQMEARHSRLESRINDLEATQRRLSTRIDELERRARSDRIERNSRESTARFESEMSQMMCTYGVATVLALVMLWGAFAR